MFGNGKAFRGHHECAVFSTDDQAANQISFRNCKANPGHQHSMTIFEFRQKGPFLFPDKDELERVWNRIDRTVRVKVCATSRNRPETYRRSSIPYPMKGLRGKRFVRYGSGHLVGRIPLDEVEVNVDMSINIEDSCRCLHCKRMRCRHGQNWRPPHSTYFIVTTATHVLYDTLEAENTEFEFFYDSDENNRKGVECIYGVKVLDDEMMRLETDTCRVVCVTHEELLADELRRTTKEELFYVCKFTRPFLISHPHGMCKRISFGEVTGIKCFVSQRRSSPVTLKKGLTVRISGNADNSDMAQLLNIIKYDDYDKKVEDNDDYDIDSCSNVSTSTGDRNGARWIFTLTLSSDLTIYGPTYGITIDSDLDRDVCGSSWYELTQDRYWALPADIQFVTDSGSPYSLPQRPDAAKDSVKFEFYAKGYLHDASLACYDSEQTDKVSPAFRFCNVYAYLKYTMASCSGSSGAVLYHDLRTWIHTDKYVSTHFGCTDRQNRTGLMANHAIMCLVDNLYGGDNDDEKNGDSDSGKDSDEPRAKKIKL